MLQILIRNAVYRAVAPAGAAIHTLFFINSKFHDVTTPLLGPHGRILTTVEHIFQSALSMHFDLV